MPKTTPLAPSSTAPATRIIEDEGKDRAPDPQRHFESPEMLLADTTVPDDKKRELLYEWDLELDNRLNAESEGMSISDPISSQNEAKLADTAARVKSSLAELTARMGPQ